MDEITNKTSNEMRIEVGRHAPSRVTLAHSDYNIIDEERQALAKAAARWWVSLLRNPPSHTSGDAYLDVAFDRYTHLLA